VIPALVPYVLIHFPRSSVIYPGDEDNSSHLNFVAIYQTTGYSIPEHLILHSHHEILTSRKTLLRHSKLLRINTDFSIIRMECGL